MHVKKKRNVYLAQVNYAYGDNVYLPYSAGMLQAFCQEDSEIDSNFRFGTPMYLREDPAAVARRLESPRVVGLSTYVWNWEYNKALARHIKALYPDCLTVFGGTQVPVKSAGLMEAHPEIDIAVHYEGEYAFAEILLESLSDRPDYTRIHGLSVRVDGNQTLKTPPRGRIEDLSKLPSPYLCGVFDPLMDQPFLFQASQETHRGCPYSCTFCDWGGATLAKVRAFEDARLVEEFEWMGRHHIEVLFNCDANYGLLPRDYDLTLKMAAVKEKHGGYPKKFRASYAKNSNDKIFTIAKVLNEVGMNKGVSLSFQSMDDGTLEIVKRKNIKIANFRELVRRYRSEGIATFTELILGLPGETYESFKRGIETLVEAGQHDSLNVYVCALFPNSEMTDPTYVQAHGIRGVRAPILLAHSTPGSDPVTEYHTFIIENRSMPADNWHRTFMFSWAVQCFHCLGLTQTLAVFCHRYFGMAYSEFYESLIEHCRTTPESLMGAEFRTVAGIVRGAMEGGRLEAVIPRFGNIAWPLEESAFLNLVSEKDALYQELTGWLTTMFERHGRSMSPTLVEDLISYQRSLVIDPHVTSSFSVDLRHDLHSYMGAAYTDDAPTLVPMPTRITIRPAVTYGGDLETYAREVVWYGRKGGKFHYSDVSLDSLQAA